MFEELIDESLVQHIVAQRKVVMTELGKGVMEDGVLLEHVYDLLSKDCAIVVRYMHDALSSDVVRCAGNHC